MRLTKKASESLWCATSIETPSTEAHAAEASGPRTTRATRSTRGSGLVSCRTAVNTLKSFGCGRLTVIVVDASVALAWVLPDTEQNVAYSARVADAGISGSDELVAPRLLTTECSYRLLK